MGVKVKICGIKSLTEVRIVNRYLPEYIGLVFAGSKRRIDQYCAARLISFLDSRIRRCGVFVNEEIEKVAHIAMMLKLDVIQLHGSEDRGYIDSLKKETKMVVWKAIRIGSSQESVPSRPDRIVLDSPEPGTGTSFDWSVLEGYRHRLGDIVIAGGLRPDNLAALIEKYRPYCVDVSSGVEKYGCKDEELVNKFISKVRDHGF